MESDEAIGGSDSEYNVGYPCTCLEQISSLFSDV